jgi:hypothetical protein
VAAVVGIAIVLVLVAACGFDGLGASAGPAAPDATTSDDAPSGETSTVGADGSSEGSTSDADGAPPLEASTPYANRVKTDLVALYEFEENTGTKAHDSVVPGLDLVIYEPTKAVWKPHAITFTSYTVIDTRPSPLTKVLTACKATNEVTVEAWIESSLTNESARTRIATMAVEGDNGNLNLALGAGTGTSIWASLAAGNDLLPPTNLTTALTHLVMTRTAADSTLRVYVDGVKVDEQTGTPTMSAWTDSALYVGDGSKLDRGWRGSIHLLAVYSKALDLPSIQQNRAAGADP